MLYVFLLGLSVFLITYQILNIIFEKGRYISRIGIYTGQIQVIENEKRSDTYRHGLGLLARGIEKSGIFENYKKNIRKQLSNANVLLRPEEYISISIIVPLFLGIFGLLFFKNFIIVLILIVIGILLPPVMLKRKKAKRLKIINNQLVDTLAVLSNAMKAGHSFFQAVDSVCRELKGPVAEEFSKLQKEISLGVETETALENLVNRVGSDDLELMITAVLIQRQIGGNLAEILDNISDTIRLRVKTKGEIKTLTAQGRMSGIIISVLPFGLAAIVSIMAPQLMMTLFTEPLGIIMIVIALLMEFIGIIFIRKIISIEV
ncbi:MAG: secretion system protein [Clostridiaceae bacterium]|nr:secretion system protein [Clostridiaceae bacterium]